MALADVDDPRSGRRLARWPPPVTGPSRSTDTPMVAAAAADHPEHMTTLIGQIPAGRLGRPEEIAAAVLWLCSPGAAFTIGHAIVSDGGLTTQ